MRVPWAPLKTRKFEEAMASLKFELLSASDAASLLNVHPRTLWRWRNEGVGPKFIPVGRQIYYSAESLSEWLQKQEVTPCREH